MILTILFILLTLILSFLSWASFKVISRKLRYPNLPPLYPGAVPIFGHLFVFLKNRRNIGRYFAKMNKNLLAKRVCTVSILNYNYHVVSDPDDCCYLSNICLNKDEVFEYGKPFFGEGLLISHVSTWKRHRKLLAPALNQQVINGFFGIFNDKFRELTHTLTNKVNTGKFDISEYVKQTSLEIICSTAMGFRNEEKNRDITREYIKFFPIVMNYFMERVYSGWLCINSIYRLSSLKGKIDELVLKLDTLTDIIITQRIEQPTDDKNETKFKPYIDLLLDLSSKNLITKQGVKDEATNIIATGYDTTQSAIIETLLVLGTYKDVQDKVFEEIQEVFSGTERDVEKSDLAKLKYLDAVIKETLRLYPVVPFTIRKIEEDITFKNYVLPAGDGIVLPLYVLNRHPVWGEDANAFNPGRWLDRSKLPETSNAFASFSIGRRNCIGINYAMTSVKIAIVHLMRKFKITADITQLRFAFKIILIPISGHLASIESRRSPVRSSVPDSESRNATEQSNGGRWQDEKE